ncbi:Ig-like domain-containing protein [Mucilaginibacter sp. PAMB04168]|uniref:Ig-like domain-containing protein n=1 Tax=Mucilaginibacter sp. PAMB04168 TaxID=3138567 RepID=UPI0031F69C77
MQRPQGGPRDRTPPKLLKATPANKTRRFNAKEIKLEFDEYFKLTSPYSEISVSPAFEKQPEYITKGQTLLIKLNDSLQKNTTYVFNFGKALADVNESNVLKNFSYVFSTGDQIDSLSISGRVYNTTTAQAEKEATVMIFPAAQDSAMFGKKKPAYYTSTDSAGNFALNNLHEGTYTIYALKEVSPDKIYNADNELIAFQKDPVMLKANVNGIELDLFKQVPEKFRISSRRFDPDGKINMVFNKPLEQPSMKIIDQSAIDEQKIVDFSRTRDTALIFLRNMNFDTVSVAIADKGKFLDTVVLRKGRSESFKRTVSLQYNINVDNKLRPGADLSMIANLPIETFDISRIKLLEDSVPVSPLNLQKSTTNPRNLIIKHRWRQAARYELVFSDEALTDIYGTKNKETTKRFMIDKPENYGTLTLKVTVPDTSKAYIVEVMDSKKTVLQTDFVTKNASIVYKNFFTGKYQVKVTYDTNKNRKADPGNVRTKSYPEKSWYNDKELTLRPNWEMEEPLVIPKEEDATRAAPPTPATAAPTPSTTPAVKP